MTTSFRPGIDTRFSDPSAGPVPWAAAEERIRAAGTWFLSTVRASGAPHVTTLLAVWSRGALHFCTGSGEQKHRNLSQNPRVALATGDGAEDGAMDLVVEGTAVRVTDEARLRELADAWVAAHGESWRFEVRDGAFHHGGGPAHVFAVAPHKVLGFAKSPLAAQLRWLPER